MTVLIVGDDAVARALAERFDRRGAGVVLVGADAEAIEAARAAGLTAHRLDLTDAGALRAVLEGVTVAVVSTAADGVNLLAAQALARDVECVVVRVNDPRNHVAFEALDADRVCATTVLAGALAETAELERPARRRRRRMVS